MHIETPVPEASSPNGCASAKGGSITTSSRDDLLPHLFLDDLGVDFIAEKATGQTRKVSAIKSKKNHKSVCCFLERRYFKVYYPLLSTLSLLLLVIVIARDVYFNYKSIYNHK